MSLDRSSWKMPKTDSILQEIFGGKEPTHVMDGSIWFDENRVLNVRMAGKWWIVTMMEKYFIDSRTLKLMPRGGGKIRNDAGEWILIPEEDAELEGMFQLGDEE
jgi:hypothetical protein